MKFHLSLILLFVLAIQLHAQDVVQKAEDKRPKNVILIIGDGTGLAQISTRFYFGTGEPNFKRFNSLGLIRTSSSSHKITDSAAGATAFASGIKSYNGAIGVNPDTVSQPTILEELSGIGYLTGLVATSSITHATPAAFYSHVASRNMHEQIAMDLTNSPVDFFAGGGLQFFTKRKDKKDLTSELKKKGLHVNATSLNVEASAEGNERLGFLLAADGMPSKLDGRDDFLPDAAEMAIEFLDREGGKGFFLMIEGSQIDWGGHDNNAEYVITEVIDFDLMIGKVLDFAEADGETLLVVTADHETGGMALSAASVIVEEGREPESNYDKIEPTFSTGGHTASLIPVFAFGPGEELFRGIYENTEIYHKIKSLVFENDLSQK